jgi:hypothetical protein
MTPPVKPESFAFSTRTAPLTDVETRAALRAIHRILVLARLRAYERADPAELADILDAVEFLPEMLLRPAAFDDLFRGTLESLAAKYPRFPGVLTEFDAAVGCPAAGRNGNP